MKILKVKMLGDYAGFSSPFYKGDAGFDVFSTIDCELKSLERKAIPLGVSLEFSEGYVCKVEQKSGNSIKYGFTTIGNIIDSNYRGEIHAIIVNISNERIRISKGQKVAQLLFHAIHVPKVEMCKELSHSDREDKKFGSSGDK